MTPSSQITYSAKPDTFISYLQKVWKYKSLIITLAKRDLKIKYAQTLLGLAWTIAQPLMGLLLFTFFFSQVVKIEVPGGNYVIFAFSGMIGWYLFSHIVYQSSTSLLQAQDLLNKIFFPKMILPIAKVMVGLVDFGVSFVLLLLLMIIFGVVPHWQIVFLPFFVLLNILVGLSVSLWLSALSIKYRDLQHIIPYFINFGIWLTPVFFPVNMIPSEFKQFMYLNPMAGIIEGYRWCVLGLDFSPYYFIGIGLSGIILLAGFTFFQRTEDKMIDVI
jgi:lipopolysaccharide transport system permease protein